MEQDLRKNWFLGEGDQIICADTVYIITGAPIGCGGSSVVYPARRSDTSLLYAVKECFPSGGGFWRQGGVIVPRDPEDAAAAALLQTHRSNLANEQRIGQLIHNISDRAVSISQTLSPIRIVFRGESFSSVSGGIFSVLERIDQKAKSFHTILAEIRDSCPEEELERTRGLPDIHTTACLMEQILCALQPVHNARDPERPAVHGYYYGDLHNGNVYFTESNIREGRVGTARLIDFGSARELDSDGYTAALTGRDVFSARGIRPPEMLSPGFFRLSRQSDLFSAACLMLQCVATPEKLLPLREMLCVGPNFLKSSDCERIGCSREVRKLLNSILDRATQYLPEKRYPSTGDMLQAIRELKEKTSPLINRLGLRLSTLAEGEFLGHEADLKKLEQYINARRRPIVLWGFPGIGKTELAIEFGRRRSRSSQVYFVRFTRSFRDTVTGPIADAFSGYSKCSWNGKPKPQEQIYQEVLALLGQCGPDDLLIIDHVDGAQTFGALRTEEYQDLCRLSMNLLLTTRCDPDGEGQWHPVEPLDPEDLYRLIGRRVQLSAGEMDSLIFAVNAHTLTLDLMARTMGESGGAVTAHHLLTSLKTGSLSRRDFPHISTTHDRSSLRTGIYGHLKVLFDLSGMSRDERTVLCCATLLPADGMNTPLFRACLRQEAPPTDPWQPVCQEQTACDDLRRKGWLSVTADHALTIHPVVRELCRAELKPDRCSCGPFLDALWEQCSAGSYDAERYAQAADCFAAADQTLQQVRDITCASRAAALYQKLGLYHSALELDRKILGICRDTLPPNHPDLAVVYNNLGAVCGDLGDYDQELQYQREALRIRQAVLPSDHLDLAASYSNLGATYSDLKDHQMALDYHEKALEIRKAALPPDHPDLAATYCNLGITCSSLRDHQSALTYQETALKIRRAILPPDHPDLAASLNNAGSAYMALRRFGEALSCLNEALAIRKSVLPENHPDLAAAYRNVGVVSGLVGDWRAAMENHCMALRIRREILPRSHPKLLLSCQEAAEACGYQGDYIKELECLLLLLELQQDRLPEDDPRLSGAYSSVALIYERLNDQPHRIDYLRKAAASGHVGSMNKLTMLLSNGKFCPPDPYEALHWTRQAYARGNATAANNLGLMYLSGRAVPRDLNEAHRLLLEARAGGCAKANQLLGQLYLGQLRSAPDWPIDPRRALTFLLEIRDRGSLQVEQLIRLAEQMLRSGR